MKVLIILHRFDNGDAPYNPTSTEGVDGYMLPIGLAYISSVLKKAGKDVTVLNLNNWDGLIQDLLKRELLAIHYDVVLLGGLSMYYPHIRDIIKYIRYYSGKTKVVVGGGIITAQPEIMFNLLQPDYGVIGEGENTVLDLVTYLEYGGYLPEIPGIIFSDSVGTITITEPRNPIMDLDTLPFPDYDAFGYKEHLNGIKLTDVNGLFDVVDNPRTYPLLASRSCIYNCLAGNTTIDTTNGTFKIKELVGTSPKVLTRDPITKDVLYAQSTIVAKTGENKALIRVCFKEGTHIDCTPDHKFITFKKGNKKTPTIETEIEASELKYGDHIRAVHYQTSGYKGYIDIVWGRGKAEKQHRLILESKLGRKLATGEHTHHIDHNIKNNIESNLTLTNKYDHVPQLHPEVSIWMKENNPSKNLPHEFFVERGKSQKGKIRSEESRMRYRLAQLGENNSNYRDGLHTGKKSRISDVNHVVESVTPLSTREDTYCLEVPGYDWFYANNVLVHNCTFCFHPLGQKYRQRSIDNIMQEIKTAVEKYHVNIVIFYDEMFSNNQERVIEFCTKFKKYSDTLPDKLWFHCQNRVDTTTDEMMKVMKASGAFLLSYGLESYSPIVLASMKKHITPEQIITTAKLTRENKLGFQGNFIFGDPAESCDTAKETLDFVKENRQLLGSSIGLFFIIPFQGTPIYKRCVRERKIPDELQFIKEREQNWFKYLEPMNMTTLSEKEFSDLKEAVFGLHLVSDTYTTAEGTWYNSPGDTYTTIKCPSCKSVFGMKNLPEPKGFGALNVGCRHCHYRFHLVSRWYPLKRFIIKTVGFRKIYRISKVMKG
jgi:radical SAM superfamily enzyme YgiQ (UPF0313 family)